MPGVARVKRASLIRLAAVALSFALFAAPAPLGAALDPRDEADIARIQAYLNRIQSLRSHFVQIAPDGALAEGLFLLKRPGRLRFEYAPPSPILVVGDGRWLILYDAELDQVSRMAIDSTPLRVLLAQDVRFDGRVVVDHVDRAPGILRLVVLDREKPEEGAITLVFSDSPLTLRQWLVTDSQGLVTTIYLSEIEVNPPLDPRSFVFIDPNPFRDEDRR